MNLCCNILSNARTPKQKFMDAEEPRQFSQNKEKKALNCDSKIKKQLTPEQKLEASRERGRLKYHRRKIREEFKQKDQLGKEDLKIDEQTIRYNEQILRTRTSQELKAVRQIQKLKRVAAPEETKNQYAKRKRRAGESIIRKAIKLTAKSQNQELSSYEKEVLKLAEQIKANRLEAFELNKQDRPAAIPPEEKEYYRLKCLEAQRKRRQEKLEKQNKILSKANELLAISEHREMSSDEKELLKLGEQLKAERLRVKELKKRNRMKQKRVLRPEQKAAAKLKRQEKQKRIREAKPGNSVVNDQSFEYYRDLRLRRAETDKRTRKRRLDKENTTLKKADELLAISQDQEISLDEKEVIRLAEQIRAKRLTARERKKRYRIIQEAVATPEEKEARRLKRLEEIRRYRQKQKDTATPEEIEAKKFRIEKEIQIRKEKREKEDLILKTALELFSQKQEFSSEGLEILKLADQIKADRLIKNERMRQYRRNRNNDISPEKREKRKLTQRQYIRKKREQIRALKQEEFIMKNAAGWLKKDQVLDEIKIEKEVLQETTIKAISVRQNSYSTLDIQQEGFIDSSCSWIQLSEKSYMTEGTSKSPRYFQSFPEGSYTIQKSFPKRNGHSTKLVWKKSDLEESLCCMRVLIDATAKRDTHVVFGREIAHKLRTSKKDEAEVNIAKLLIDNILQNLITGVYNSEKIIA